MSVPQDRNVSSNDIPDLTPDPLPPDVKIIECSCALADSRTEDNSKWINVIKEPIEISKGSEIRILSNYIDMRGIDSEIIQFQNTGPTQDNAHTLLTQLYTTNDGYNNKTTSYDYMCYGEGFDIVDPGEGYGVVGSTYTTAGYGGSGVGAQCFKFTVDAISLRPKNITITNGGQNYENGAIFRIIGSAAANDYVEGKIITDDIGAIVGVKLNKFTCDTLPPNPNQLDFIAGTLGTGGAFSNIFTTQGLRSEGVDYPLTDSRRGQGYLRGDILSIEDLPTTGKNAEINRASIEVNQIYTGVGQISNNPFYDQGYNYQQTPVERWSQTYELSSAFCYGANTGTRTFTSHGQQVSIQDEASHQVNDKCLSASNLILNKEDEFAPGIYHTGNDTDEFFLNAPVLYFDRTATTGQFEVIYNNGNWVMEMTNGYDGFKINGNSVNSSPFNIMPQGSVWQFQLDFSDPVIAGNPTPTQLQELNAIAQNWCVPMRVKELLINQETFGGGSKGTRVVFGNSIVDFKGEVTDWQLGAVKSGTGVYPPNSTILIETDFLQSEDSSSSSTPTTNPVFNFQTDSSGIVINSELVDRGSGVRTGMVFIPKDYPSSSETIYITQVDFTNGWTFPAPLDQVLQNSTLTTSAGDNLNLFLVPIMAHSNLTETISAENKGNRIGYRQKGHSPFILDRFPLTFEQGLLEPTPAVIETDNVKARLSNGVYKSAGLPNSDDPLFETDQGVLANHDTEINLEIVNNNSPFETHISLPFGTNPSDVIVPYPSDWLYDPTDSTHYLRIHTANWNTATSNSQLPQFCLFQIESDNNTTRKTYLQLGGLNKTDATYSYIDIISKDIINNEKVVHYTSGTIQIATGLYRINTTTNTGYDNFNGLGITEVNIKWIKDYKNFNTQISCKWNDMTGSIGITGQQNFFNLNDPNYNTMRNEKLYQVDPLIRNSYNKGGFYFFTHLQGILSTQDGTNFDYDLLSIDNPNKDRSADGANIPNQFNQGYDFWNFAQLDPNHYAWRDDYQTPTNTNFNQSITNITNLWEYQPLYRQKFFEIEKNFCVASDISGIWTRRAHALTGAINPATGEEYVPATETGILQNEFIMAIYGSNNLISPTGTYIKDNTRFPDSGGLEPGHVVGKQYVTENTKWLAGSLMAHLPKDVNNRTFYYVFFRTPWTKIRAYDPLKESSTTAGNPDRTPLTTVNQDAYLIGNANALGSTTKKALNGDTMLQTTNPVPIPTPPNPDNKAYELGESGGVAVGGTPVAFGERSFYPIYYLDIEERENYPKAKISQFVGSTNLTLAFATDISTFTFQFLHQPYTSPFIDGVGGTNSIRVFFGNRKSGIFNHESLGGVVVKNYARPDFPKNIFTRTEITNNPTFNPQFIYGIDPLRSVGYVGRQFLNKLGFTDNDIGVIKGQIATNNTQLGYKLTGYSKDITSMLDSAVGSAPPTTIIYSYNTVFYGTTGSDIDSSDAILSEIPAPETNAGLESHNKLVTPNSGTSNKILQKFGDFIFYPYSLNTDTNSFQDTALVRFDNASSTYGSVGGLLISNHNRGCGLPNIAGSTFITDDSSIPRTLNPDCELYLAYTVACGSSLKQASLLPQRLTNAYLIILSSLMREANLYMPKAGFVNAMSIVSKTFLQGDFILSQGQLSFYAKEDFILSQIETEIKDTQFTSPSTLGVNSSVIYQITNYNPQPKKQLPTIEQEQEQDYQIMEVMSEHMDYLRGNTQTSALNELNKDLYSLGLNVLTGGEQNLDIIAAIRNQIRTYDLANLTPGERQQFFRTPEGQGLIQNATDLAIINSQIGSIAQAQNDVDQVYNGEKRLEDVTRLAQREIQQREQNIRNRIPIEMFNPPAQDVLDFYSNLPQPQQSLIFEEPYTTLRGVRTYPSLMPQLLNKIFTTKEEREDTEKRLQELNEGISSIRKNVSPTKSPHLHTKRVELVKERDELLKSLKQHDNDNEIPVEKEEESLEEVARRMGRSAIRRAGYTPQDIADMEAYGRKEKFGDVILRRRRSYKSALSGSPFKPPHEQSESGIASSSVSDEIVEEE